jgi:hypothetical protein
MSQIFVRFSSRFVQIILLVFISLCVGRPEAATCQSGGPGASADPSRLKSAIPVIREQTRSPETPGNKSKKDSFILTEGETLLLLLFSSILFAVATVIKLKLSRVDGASSQCFEPSVSQTASRSETSS